ncbi:MAG: FAD-dependent oxidoreductase [Nitrososphaerota archaeon]|nr:FAD-dependent oxidoreductase [Nitrososphaerota archaeon]MDG6922883.1 FAD-dependent oxidoreductase [Nitrososphaerota archaeon]
MSTNVTPDRVGGFPFPKADPQKRLEDFSEVQQPYTYLQVVEEAKRCLLCGTPVCINACPVQLDVRGMCEAVSRGDLQTAHKRIRETNPLLGVTARCCPQLQTLCEDACVMRWDGQPISIGMIQRFVSDWEQQPANHLSPPDCASDTGKHVSVVGAGPAGLAAADLLRRYGHRVTVYEELDTPGGTAWYGIPNYHLPKDALLYEINRIREMGVETKTGVRVGRDLKLTELLSEGSSAVLITTGSKDVVKLNTSGINLSGVFDGYEFLMSVYGNGVENYQSRPNYDLGSEVLVIGGGDTALDVARTSKRLTNGNVTVVYRRTESEMPADPIMVDEAREEGIKFMFLSDPKQYDGDGKLESVTMDTMKLGEPDSTGRRSPEPVAGKEFVVKCSSVLLAVGRGPNSFLQIKEGLKLGKKKSIAVDDHFRTSMTGVFAAGDVTTGESLVVRAMGSGRNAAQRIHEFLMGIDGSKHTSLYEQYFSERSFERMMNGVPDQAPPL